MSSSPRLLRECLVENQGGSHLQSPQSYAAVLTKPGLLWAAQACSALALLRCFEDSTWS